MGRGGEKEKQLITTPLGISRSLLRTYYPITLLILSPISDIPDTLRQPLLILLTHMDLTENITEYFFTPYQGLISPATRIVSYHLWRFPGELSLQQLPSHGNSMIFVAQGSLGGLS